MGRNDLHLERSPYLLQHRDNPIWWKTWNSEAFEQAKRENRPIFLSIGYATCHWCHVMERDSFEDDGVANILNRNFVSIKVDREERPDVDAIYMSALMALTGRGGWPMTVLLTPELRPFWAGTFLQRDHLVRLLQQIVEIWNSAKRAELVESSDHIYKHLMEASCSAHPQLEAQDPAEEAMVWNDVAKRFTEQLSQSFDSEDGGFGMEPKFPPSMALMTLMRQLQGSGDEPLLKMVCQTLDGMCRGGMYDQLGGGFHRYSVDKKWHVPHFEKMLYDNALLAMTYCEAYQLTKNADYRRIAQETLEYVLRDLEMEDGAFASAEDADSEGTEGKFYCWQWQELHDLLTEDEFREIAQIYNVRKSGNFAVDQRVAELERAAGMKELEHANVLHLSKAAALPSLNDPLFVSAKTKLLEARRKRHRPLRDQKILTGWNGLMIAALAKCGRAFGESNFTAAALRAAQFLTQHLQEADGRLLRRYCEGEAAKRATLEDYSFLIYGLCELYETTFDATWLVKAQALQTRQDEDFWSDQHQCYYDTDGKDSSLLYRPRELTDSALPSGNSAAALNLLKLGRLSGDLDCLGRSRAIIRAGGKFLSEAPQAFPFLMQALLAHLDDTKREVTIPCSPNSPDVHRFFDAIRKDFMPHTLFACGLPSTLGGAVPILSERSDAEKFTVYICENFSCQLPVTDVGEALRQLAAH